MEECTSITTLPDSIGCLSRLRYLCLNGCYNLQKLPTSIGQLTALEDLRLGWCGRLEALPDSITALRGLRQLFMDDCSSLSNLPATFGLLTALYELTINLGTEKQAIGMGPRIVQLSALMELQLRECSDEVIATLDSLGMFGNLPKLNCFFFRDCPSMTKLPETTRLLTNLTKLGLWACDKLQELPNSIGEFKVLSLLIIAHCSSLETLPDSLGGLTSLKYLSIVGCTSMIQLPMSIGQLSRLNELHIQDCRALLSLPDSIRLLNSLLRLHILDCGLLENLELLRVLQGLRIWGCTSTTELPGSCLVVVDNGIYDPAWFWDSKDWNWCKRNVKEVQRLEVNDCGFLRLAQDIESGRSILQCVHKLPCCKKLTIRLDSGFWSADDIEQLNAQMTLLERGLTDDEDLNHALKLAILARSINMRTFNALQTYLRVRECTDEGQLNALKTLVVRQCTNEAISLLETSRTIKNLNQLVKLEFYECLSITKLPKSIGQMMNLESLELWRCEEVQVLPNSIGQLKVLTTLVLRECNCIRTLPDSIGDLKVLTTLELRKCNSLQTLPESLGALTSLQYLYIVECTSITQLPMSIGHLSSLRGLNIQGCGELQSVPDSLRHLNLLAGLQISDCGASLERLGLLRALQGLRIWGCTSIAQLPASCIMVLDITLFSWGRDVVWDGVQWNWIPLKVNEEQVLETNDCGFLRHVQEGTRSGRLILQRVHSSPCHMT